MVVLYEEVLDVSCHMWAACTFGVVPVQVDSGKFLSCPVCGDIVVCEQCLEEMICMAFIGVLDAKVIYDEDEYEWAPSVSP